MIAWKALLDLWTHASLLNASAEGSFNAPPMISKDVCTGSAELSASFWQSSHRVSSVRW